MQMSQARDIQNRAAALLKPLEDEFGVIVGVEGGKVSPDRFKLSFTFSEKASEGRLSYSPVEVGSNFTYGGKMYRITNYEPSRPRFPVSAERLPDGKRFKFPLDVVKAVAKV